MTVNMKNSVSITDTKQDFSRIVRLVDRNGSVVIVKNNVPQYVIFAYSEIKKESPNFVHSETDIKEIRQLLKKEMAQKGTTATAAFSGNGWEAHVKEQYAKF